MKKFAVWLCALVCIVMGCLVPCGAESWDEVTPTFSNRLTLLNNNGTYERNTEAVCELVDKAYQLGMFGGSAPVAILYRITQGGEGYSIMVLTPTTNSSANWVDNSFTTGSKRTRTAFYITNQNVACLTIGQATTRTPFCVWYLMDNGDWMVTAHYGTTSGTGVSMSNVTVGQNTTVINKVVATYMLRGEARWNNASWNNTYGYGYSTGGDVDQGILSITAKYDEQLAKLDYIPPDPVPPTVSYQLDIAAIFDGYFAGVRDSLGAFDINLFGINIIGVLIAFVVIAVVAFIVRKLWK